MLAILICFIKHGVENNISCQRETRLRGIGDKQCFNYALFFTRLGTMAIWWCMELHTDINMIKKTHITK